MLFRLCHAPSAGRFAARTAERISLSWLYIPLHAAKHSTVARNGINTRMTYKAAFAYFASKLKELGVKTVEMFKRIIHAMQSRECEDRRKDLEAKKEAEAKVKDNGGKIDAPAAKPMRLMERFGRTLARFGIPLPSIFTHSDNNFK